MKARRKGSGWITLLIIIVLLCTGGYFLWNGSLFGNRLPDFTLQNTSVVATGIDITPEFTLEVPAATAQVTASPIVLSTPTPQPENVQPVCGEKEPMTLLVLGIDEHEQSDVIRIVRVDFIEKRVLVLSIPRDFWVSMSGMVPYGITESKINAAYGYGEYFKGAGQGVVETSSTLFQNYGITFDRYVVFHFSNFEQMIDAVGGVDVVLDAPIGAYGTAGTTHLDGKTALEYARNRNADNDLYRIQRQTVIIKSLFSKLILPENLLKLPGLGLRFVNDKSLITDVSLRDISTFVCMAGQLQNVSLVMRDIPPELYQSARTSTGMFLFIPSPEVNAYIQNLVVNGNY